MERLTLKGQDNFLENYLKPALADSWIEPLYPNSPRHPRQKYKVTIKGMIFVQSINDQLTNQLVFLYLDENTKMGAV